jgi:hypothetical protein
MSSSETPPRRYLHFGFQFSGPLDTSVIEKQLDRAKDWIRYAPNCWVVYTRVSPARWRRRLLAVHEIRPHSFFICEIDPEDSDGFIRKSFWQWIEKEKE